MILNETLDLHITETPVRARDAVGHEVRPAGWSDYHEVIAVEPLRGPYVRLLWKVGNKWTVPYTVFEGDEWLAIKP